MTKNKCQKGSSCLFARDIFICIVCTSHTIPPGLSIVHMHCTVLSCWYSARLKVDVHENIADFGPSARPINPACQLKNTFLATNESLTHSYFRDHWPCKAQWEDEINTDRLRWHVLDGLHAGCMSTIKAKECLTLRASNRYFITRPNSHFSAKVRGVLIKTFSSFREIIKCLTVQT